MTRYALTLCAGILTLAVTACVPPTPIAPPAPQPPAPPRVAAVICTPGDVNSFIQAIHVLEPSYNPNTNPANYEPPYRHSSPFDRNLNPDLTTDLENAFRSAPFTFQQNLCNLHGVYISPAACSNKSTYTRDGYRCNALSTTSVMENAWGFRSFHVNAEDLGNRYIAISARLWADKAGNWTSRALRFHEYQDMLLGKLADWRTAQHGPHITTVADPDDPWMTVLAALTHEYGHVHWARTVLPGDVGDRDGPGGNVYKFSELTACSTGTGAFNFFTYWSYNNNTNRLRPRFRWRKFKDRDTAGRVKIDHKDPPKIAQFESSGIALDTKSNLFVQLYQREQPWASYFGSLTADEDFIETYVLKVLSSTQPKLKKLPVTVFFTNGSTQTVDIPNDLSTTGKPALVTKMGCIKP